MCVCVGVCDMYNLPVIYLHFIIYLHLIMQNNYLDVITTDTFKHDVKTPLYMIHPYHASSAT